MGIFGSIFGAGTDTDMIKGMIAEGAAIIDVRTPAEFQGGHVAGSINMPLQGIQGNVDEIKALGKKVVLCCASGNRSGQATSYLKSAGIECENGGGWMEVNALV